MIRKFFALVLCSFMCFGLVACSTNSSSNSVFGGNSASHSSKKKQSSYPKTRNEEQLEKMGKIGGDDGLINKLLGFGGSSKNSDGTISVDGYLWRAVIDTTYKLPVERIEPQYGILMTGWHILPDNPGMRYKLNVYITSDRLHADSIKVSAFKQRKIGTEWTDVGDADVLARSIEERILFRARALKVGDK